MRNDRRFNWVLALSLVAMGLLAGLFYAFSCAVLPGLQNADERTLIDGMQHIDTAIENPVFFASFLGAPALTIWALLMARGPGSQRIFRWLAVAAALALLGIVVTGAFSLPLNDDLKNAGDAFRIGDPGKVRDDYVGPWVAWNIARTLLFTGSFTCLAAAVFERARGSADVGPVDQQPHR
jgi:uncharacterized membrane protein